MNILIIDNSVAFTGAFKCALSEAELLSDKHRFIFVLPPGSKVVAFAEKKGFKVYTLPMVEIRKSAIAIARYPFHLFRNTLRLRSIAKREKIDIVQVNDFYNLLGVTLQLSGFQGRLFTYVRFLPSVIPLPLRKLWTGAAQRYSNKVVAVSDAVLKQLPQKQNTIRIYDPIHLKENNPEKYPGAKPTVCFLYLANYIHGKGQDYALEAFSKATMSCGNIRLRFMGGDMGLDKNRAFREHLQQRAAELGIGDIVSFEPFSSEVEQEIKSADIVLNFSDAESFSMTCLEASYYGTAVIATRCGGPEEIIADGITGLLVSKADTDAMASAMIRLAGDIKERTQFAAAGREYVRTKFNTAAYKITMESIIN